MSGYGEFSGAIDGLRGVEEVSPEYRHRALEVYAGILDEGDVARAVELRAAPAGTGPAVDDAFSQTVQSWWSVSDARGVVDLLRWGLDPRPWALVADDGEETLATAWEALDDQITTDVVTAVGETLAAASAEGVTHGNLRPAHVRLPESDPAARVDDWGLGRAVAEAEGGTFVTGFTAPEQLEDSTVEGVAVDTYGLAALAYFALTERPPFPEERAAILGERPQPVSEFRPDLPDAVDDLVMRGLRRDPDERPVGPGAFAAEFGDAMAGRGTAAGGTAAGGAAAGGAATGSSGATAGADAAAGDDTASGEGSTSDGVAGAASGAAAGGVAAGGAADTGGADGEDTGGGATGPGEAGGGQPPDDAGAETPDSPVPEEPLAGSDPGGEDDSGPPGDEGTGPPGDEDTGPLDGEDTGPLEEDDASPIGEEDPEPLEEDDSEPLEEDDSEPLSGDDTNPRSEDSSAPGGQRGAEPGSRPAGPTPEQPSPSPRESSDREPSPHGPPPREPTPGAEGGAAEPYAGDTGGEATAPERTVGDRVNRRTVLAGGGLLAALAAVGAGAWAFLGGGSSGGVDLSAVPDRAETVAAVDVAGLRESDALAGALNAQLPLSLPLLDADTLAGVLDGVASRTGMDPAGVRQAVSFAARSAGPGTYAGLVLETEWDGDSLSSSLEAAGESLAEETYADSRLFVAEYADLTFPVAVGEVGEGRYAVGTRPEVEDVLETASGSTPSVGGRQVEAFRAAADGQVRVGSLLPSDLLSGTLPESVPDPVVAALTETARNVEYVSGSVGADGSARLRAETGSSEAAETAAAQLRAASTLAADELGGAGSEGALATLARLLDEASVSQEGTSVTVGLSSAYELLAAALAATE